MAKIDVAGILGAASRDLCRVRDVSAAASALERWAGEVVGARTAVALWLLEDDGRLRNVFGSPDVAPRSKARRRMVLRTNAPDVMDVGPTRASALFPLLVRDEAIGVMEVTASRGSLRECVGPLEVLANQVGVVAEHVGRESRWSSRVASMTRVLELGRSWSELKTDEQVVRSSVRCVHDVVQAPVAGWLAHENDDGVVWRFVGSKGIGNGQRELLAEGDLERGQILARFREATGRSETSVIGSKRAVVVLADAGDDAPILAPLASMMDEAMERSDAKRQMSRRYRQLDLGLAITAHEIRGPLLGARAALESVRADEVWSEANRHLLWRTQQELEELAGTADGLLRWASTAQCVRARSQDLVPLLQSAVATVDGDAHRVRVDAAAPLRARVNASQLRGAVVNLIRNALAYSPSDGVVRVSVSSADDWAIIDVQDDGPGIPEEMQASIFDPFARGPASDSTEGSGLGLFIARRVVEAHDGSLALVGGPPTTFRIQLPAADGMKNTHRRPEQRRHPG
jgi:signal transduction histidine kinase